MKFLKFSVIAIVLAIATSCTLDKTDFEAELIRDIPEYYDFEEVTSFNNDNYKIIIKALNGTFYKGYNEVRLIIVNIQTNQVLNDAEVTFLPILINSEDNTTSCPHRYNLVYNTEEQYYSGYSVFTKLNNPMEDWVLHISFTDNNQTYNVNTFISVENQTNKNLNMTEFVGNDGELYFIALVAPQSPEVAENELVAGIYKYNQPNEPEGTFPDPNQFSYSEVPNHTLLLDPRMPEPSMGNHSSPNNIDLTQQSDGLYYGIVNYTMTGNWTLNFILLNQNGEVIKGTEVPNDFTPGIEGAKSELHIDILF
ncbi:MAG: hypothetical protein RBR78_10455 [Flavobacteriaceae bacterium]|jgi:hypothetical protein|nr:hypothetical protein [Flavobacteriaceae bacterium]